jgi:hypothetical protein
MDAITAMSRCSADLDLLALAVLPSRVDTPYYAGGTLESRLDGPV